MNFEAKKKIKTPFAITVVADVGARYGMHPTWRSFKGGMKYLMFEPDAQEASRLRGKLDKKVFEIFETALDSVAGERTFYLLKHRGLSSFLKPDLTSECFRRLKPGQAKIEKEIRLQTKTIDSVAATRKIAVDFLKVDTEGTEHDVITGARAQLTKSILGIRSSCNFQPCFYEQKLFSETHNFLLSIGFVLLNMDYRGFGYPRLGLFRKPDPIEPEDFRYGTLVAADAVWICKSDFLKARYRGDRVVYDLAILKTAYFCMLNNAPDVGVDIIREHVSAMPKRGISNKVKDTRLFKSLQLEIANFLGRWRTVPDQQWERASGVFQKIYGLPLKGGSEFYPQIQEMEKSLQGKARNEN